MKTRTTIEFSGTVGELKQLLSERFADEQIILQCSISSDGVMEPLTDPLFQALIDFCAEHGEHGKLIHNKAVIHLELYDAKSLAYKSPIEAIKKIRNVTGLGLKEAKDFVEQYLRNNPPDGTASAL